MDRLYRAVRKYEEESEDFGVVGTASLAAPPDNISQIQIDASFADIVEKHVLARWKDEKIIPPDHVIAFFGLEGREGPLNYENNANFIGIKDGKGGGEWKKGAGKWKQMKYTRPGETEEHEAEFQGTLNVNEKGEYIGEGVLTYGKLKKEGVFKMKNEHMTDKKDKKNISKFLEHVANERIRSRARTAAEGGIEYTLILTEKGKKQNLLLKGQYLNPLIFEGQLYKDGNPFKVGQFFRVQDTVGEFIAFDHEEPDESFVWHADKKFLAREIFNNIDLLAPPTIETTEKYVKLTFLLSQLTENGPLNEKHSKETLTCTCVLSTRSTCTEILVDFLGDRFAFDNKFNYREQRQIYPPKLPSDPSLDGFTYDPKRLPPSVPPSPAPPPPASPPPVPPDPSLPASSPPVPPPIDYPSSEGNDDFLAKFGCTIIALGAGLLMIFKREGLVQFLSGRTREQGRRRRGRRGGRRRPGRQAEPEALGGEGGGAEGGGDGESGQPKDCMVCYEVVTSVCAILQPCGHGNEAKFEDILCVDCAINLLDQGHVCPICRTNIQYIETKDR